jgi:glycosyltransferase involved in cell wall biosynthesis
MSVVPVSAVIVVKNAEKTIKDCLESVRCNHPAEIIVIDGRSADRTLDIAGMYTERIYSDAGKGVSFAHQIGLEKASRPHVAFVDADIVLPDGALEAMLEELKSGGFANVQARLMPLRSETYWERAQDIQVRSHQSRIPGGLSACVLDKETALKIGFDPAIRITGDDTDFLYRLKDAGYKASISSVSATHVHRADFNSLVRQKFWYGRAKPALIRKHGPWKGDLWAPAVMAYWLAQCVVKGQPELVPYVLVSGLADSAGMVRGLFEIRRYEHKEGSGTT